MKKIIQSIARFAGGLIKPTPGSSIITVVGKAIKNKEYDQLAGYLIGAILLWGVITGKITIDDAKSLKELLF